MCAEVLPREILCKSALNKTGIPGYQYCLNPYVGCVHACVYCYASFMCRFTNHQENWGRFSDVKINLPEVLAKQLAGRTRPQGRVLVGTVTDAYQPVEAIYAITRSSLQILADYQLLEVHILTKSSLVQRDILLLRQMRACEVGFTLTTLDWNIARVFEPGASPPQQRLAAAHALVKAGIPVWVFIAPLLPGITDTEESLTELLRAVLACGVREILLDNLNPYPAVVQRLRSVYRRYFPQALPALEVYLRHPKLYRDKITARLQELSELTGCHPYFV